MYPFFCLLLMNISLGSGHHCHLQCDCSYHNHCCVICGCHALLMAFSRAGLGQEHVIPFSVILFFFLFLPSPAVNSAEISYLVSFCLTHILGKKKERETIVAKQAWIFIFHKNESSTSIRIRTFMMRRLL